MKYDCSKILDYLHERDRMCKSISWTKEYGHDCKKCPLYPKLVSEDKSRACNYLEDIIPEFIEIVQKWSDEHTEETILDEFKKKYPNAPIDSDGIPSPCVRHLGYECNEPSCCEENACIRAWSRTKEEAMK